MTEWKTGQRVWNRMQGGYGTVIHVQTPGDVWVRWDIGVTTSHLQPAHILRPVKS